MLFLLLIFFWLCEILLIILSYKKEDSKISDILYRNNINMIFIIFHSIFFTLSIPYEIIQHKHFGYILQPIAILLWIIPNLIIFFIPYTDPESSLHITCTIIIFVLLLVWCFSHSFIFSSFAYDTSFCFFIQLFIGVFLLTDVVLTTIYWQTFFLLCTFFMFICIHFKEKHHRPYLPCCLPFSDTNQIIPIDIPEHLLHDPSRS